MIGVACFVFVVTSSSAIAAQPAPPAFTGTLVLKAEGITVRHPAGWSGVRQANLHVLYNVPAQTLNTLGANALVNTARIFIHTERRKDHGEAVRQLKEIEAEATSPSTFLSIGGWPALQRRHLTIKPLPGQDAPGSAASPEMVVQITTAVAVSDLLVRLESLVAQDAPSQVANEVEEIGRSLSFATTGNPAQVDQEIQNLRGGPKLRSPAPLPGSQTFSLPGAPEPSLAGSAGVSESAGASVRVTNQGGRQSELEVAVSPNGRNIVVGSNNFYFFSTDVGQTWNISAGSVNGNGNDPSLGWGQSGGPNGTFYAANIAAPSTAISVSTDNGANFAFRANAYTCAQNGDATCGAFPDQEHIAVDRFNVAAGGDQVYSAWRNLDGNWGIVCSANSGNAWSTNGFFSAGDFPRITVGQDGFVYVVYLNGNNIRLSKFNSCENNQNPMVRVFDQPVVAGLNHVGCPVPGLDRCSANGRNTITSPTVAVDDLNANHVYIAYAVNTSPGGGGGFPNITNQNTANESIVIQDSLDGGSTWNAADPNRRVTISAGVTARRFMPWVCTVGGVAHVTWYDRRAASPGGTTVSNNSLTDFFAGRASLNVNGNLSVGTEFKVNDPGTTDAQCEAGSATGTAASWPAAVDNQNASESCSVQPQLGGRCCTVALSGTTGQCPVGSGSNNSCDFSPDTCTGGETCQPGRGSPKYGDYNGSACSAGHLYMAWASATAPATIAASTNIDTFFSVALVSGPQINVPGNLAVGDTCVGSTNIATLNVCNTGVDSLQVNSISSSNTQFVVTAPTSGYPVAISPDFCFPFQVRFTPTSTGAKSSTLTIVSNDPVNPSVTVQATGNGSQQQIATLIPNSGSFGDVCVGTFADLNLTISNSGACLLSVTNITSSNLTQFEIAGTVSFPLNIAGGGSIQVPIRFHPTSFGPKTANITVSSNDPASPTRVIAVSGNAPSGKIAVTGSTDFGDVCTGPLAEKTIKVCNIGTACTLNVTSVAFNPACSDFTLVNNPFPALVSHDSCLDVVIRFTPTSAGSKSCTLVVTSDDPTALVVTRTVTANTPAASIDVPPNLSFLPEVIQSAGVCTTTKPFPVSNTGTCNLTINSIAMTGGANQADFSFSGLPSSPIILQPGHVAGEGNLKSVFAPTAPLDRDKLGILTVNYVSDPVTGATTNVTRDLCGEAVLTGARVLVRQVVGGVPTPLATVEKIQLQRINANRNRKVLDTNDVVQNATLQTVPASGPGGVCASFQFHREYGTVGNPIQLLAGSYQVTASAIIDGKRKTKTVGFNVDTCDFNPQVIIDF